MRSSAFASSRRKIASSRTSSRAGRARIFRPVRAISRGVKLVAAQVDGADAGALRNAVDQLKDKLKSAVIVLASVDATNKITLVAGVTADQTGKVKAGELVGNVAGQVGGKGGGRPDFAQAGGNNPAALGAALCER